MQNTITINKPSKYISSHDIEGIDNLEELLISTEYFDDCSFEQTVSGDVLAWVMRVGCIEYIIENINERIKDSEEMREDAIKLKTLLEDLLQAMQEAEIDFIMIDK